MAIRLSSQRLPRPLVALAFVAAYAVAFAATEHAYGSLAVPSPFWLPDSVLLCALLLAPRTHWWFYVVAVWPVRLVLDAVPGTPPWFQVATTANDVVKALAGAWLLQGIVGREIRLTRLNELLWFFAIPGVMMSLASALGAAPLRFALGREIWTGTVGWFLGDALTQVVVTPTLLYWCTGSHRNLRGRLVECLAVCVSLVATVSYVFLTSRDMSPSLAFLYVPVPFLVWAAVRLRPFGTANAIALVAIISMLAAVRGTGIFAGGASVLPLQLFLLVVAVPLLMLAVVVGERAELFELRRTFNTRLLQAQDRERTRIAGELHDDVGQRLALLKLDLDLLAPTLSGHAASTVTEAAQRADDVVTSVRNLSHRLHPQTLSLIGLVPALNGLVAESSGHGPRVVLNHQNAPKRLPQELTVMLFRIAQEALQNAVKHSRAELVLVRVHGGPGRVTVTVEDNGVGFVVDTVRGQGLGLMSMAERAEAHSAIFAVQSYPRRGTRIDVTVRVPATDETAALAV